MFDAAATVRVMSSSVTISRSVRARTTPISSTIARSRAFSN
jgi:hypothetical protein